MSVAAERSHSPNHFGNKRLFERTDTPEYQLAADGRSKRFRRRSSSSSDLCGSPQKGGATDRASTLAALRGLFPDMEEKVRKQCMLQGFVLRLCADTWLALTICCAT